MLITDTSTALAEPIAEHFISRSYIFTAFRYSTLFRLSESAVAELHFMLNSIAKHRCCPPLYITDYTDFHTGILESFDEAEGCELAVIIGIGDLEIP